jgi:predicted nucleotidyltransferase
MAVFGSSVREDYKEKSDLDIVVDFQSDDFLLFNSSAEEFEVILGKKIDLITLRSLKPRHLHYIQNQMIHV